MSTLTLAIIIAALAGILLGALLIWPFARARATARREALEVRLQEQERRMAEQRQTLTERQERIERLERELADLRATSVRLETNIVAERRLAQEKLALLEQTKQTLSEHFKTVAGEIFENRSQTFATQSNASLEQLLKPFREQIAHFQSEARQTHEQGLRERSALKEQLQGLEQLNRQLSADAANLTSALRGRAQTQGAWGEMILERLLEISGLRKGREYEVQQSLTNEEGQRQRPDVILRLPEGRNIVIDSKVSLVAYTDMTSTENEDERRAALGRHIQSIRTHIRGLAERDYQRLFGGSGPGFVLLFMPIEGALLAALEGDQALFVEAFDKNIVLVSPTTLFAVLRMIENLWRIDNQNRNAREIADRAGKLYDKFVGFVESLTSLGDNIDRTRADYDTAMKRLKEGRGNLIGRAAQLKELGAQASKELPSSLLSASGARDVDVASDGETAAD